MTRYDFYVKQEGKAKRLNAKLPFKKDKEIPFS